MADDVWSGVPDELRRLVEAYGDAREAFARAVYTEPDNDALHARQGKRWTDTHAALVAALRDLVQDRDRLEVFFGMNHLILDGDGQSVGLDLERWRAMTDGMLGRRRAKGIIKIDHE